MEPLLRAVERAIATIAVAGAWISILVMIGVRVYDVVARQFTTTPSGLLALFEHRAFMFLVVLGLGYAYVRGAHVQISWK